MTTPIKLLKPLLVLLLFIQTNSWSHTWLKSPAETDLISQILETGKKIDQLYLSMAELEQSQRVYADFKKDYLEIEVELISILDQNKSKKKNADQISNCETMLKKFREYKEKHKQSGTPTDADLKLNHEFLKEYLLRLLDAEIVKSKH